MRKSQIGDRRGRDEAKLLLFVVAFSFGILCFSGCHNGEKVKNERTEKNKPTASAQIDECNEICGDFQGKKHFLCVTMCRPSLSNETMRLKHSSEMDDLLTCDNVKIKVAVDYLENIQKVYLGKDEGLFDEDWPICYPNFFNRSIYDDFYWDVIKYGLPAIPCLIEKTKDTSLTQEKIPYFSDPYGQLRTGDVAFLAIMDMVKRSDNDIYAIFNGDANVDGFYAYYEFVKDDSNRILLSERLNKWWQTESGNLIWIKAPCHGAGGFWTTEEYFKEMVERTAKSFFR